MDKSIVKHYFTTQILAQTVLLKKTGLNPDIFNSETFKNSKPLMEGLSSSHGFVPAAVEVYAFGD